jgi:hypothetical protein
MSVFSGGIMKIFISAIAVFISFSMAGLSSAQYRGTQDFEGYTMLGSPSGQQVCLGRWVPSPDVALPGTCEGRLVDVAQFTAISAKMSADKLDQLITILESIDQKMSISNDLSGKLLETAIKTQTSMDQQVSQSEDLLLSAIIERFDGFSEELLKDDKFRQALTKLKEEILKDVEKRYPPPAAPAKK